MVSATYAGLIGGGGSVRAMVTWEVNTVAVCWGGITESSPLSASWLLLAAQQRRTGRLGRSEQRRKNPSPWVHLLLLGGCFLFLRKEILQHHSWLPHLPGFLGQEVKRHNRRHSTTVWQQVRKQHLHQRAADSREKVLLDHPKWTPKVWTEKPSAASSLCRADPSWRPSSMSVWGEITFYPFAELLFDQEIGAHSSSWEVGRSPGEEQREGPSFPRSSVRWQDQRQTAPCCFQEPGSRKWFMSSEHEMVCRQSASYCLCPRTTAKPQCLGEGRGKEPGLVDICSTQATAEKEATGQPCCSLSLPSMVVPEMSASSSVPPKKLWSPGGNWPSLVIWQIAPCLNLDPGCLHPTTKPAMGVCNQLYSSVKCRKERLYGLCGPSPLMPLG